MTEVSKHTRRTASGKTTTVRQHYRNTGSGGDQARQGWAQRVAASQPPHVSGLPPELPADGGEQWWDEDDTAAAGEDFWADDGVTNICTGNAQVGVQGHTFTGVTIDMTGDGMTVTADGPGPPRRKAAQHGPVNVASGSDRVGVQAGRSAAFEGLAQEMRDWRALGEPELPPEEAMEPGKPRLLGCDTPEGMLKFRRLKAYREAGYNGPLDQDNNIPDPDDPANHDWMGAAAGARGPAGAQEAARPLSGQAPTRPNRRP